MPRGQNACLKSLQIHFTMQGLAYAAITAAERRTLLCMLIPKPLKHEMHIDITGLQCMLEVYGKTFTMSMPCASYIKV